jgi:hypothetical protein
MKFRFTDCIVLLIFGCMTFFHLRGFDRSSQKGFPGEEMASVLSHVDFEWPERRQRLLFFIDFRDFSCMTCLDSFLDFYRRLPPRFQTEDSMGILVLDPEKRDKTSSEIARVKLRGFVLSNHIIFPVQVDRFHVFRGIAQEGTSVVLFDYDREIIKRFLFPLRQQDLDELFRCLTD